MRTRIVAKSGVNAVSKIASVGGISALVLIWALFALIFSKFFDFTGYANVFVTHTFKDCWGNNITLYEVDVLGSFRQMFYNFAGIINLCLKLPDAPNLGNVFSIDIDSLDSWAKALLAIPIMCWWMIRIVLYVFEIGVWMAKVLFVAPICLVMTLAGGVYSVEGGYEFAGGLGGALTGWLNFSLSGWLNAQGQ